MPGTKPLSQLPPKQQDQVNKLKSQAYDDPASVFSKNVDPQKVAGNSPSLGTKIDSGASLDKLKSNAVSSAIDSGEKKVGEFFSKDKPAVQQAANFDPKSTFTPARDGKTMIQGQTGKPLNAASSEIEDAKLSRHLPPELRKFVLPRMSEIPKNNKNQVLNFLRMNATGDLNIREIYDAIDEQPWIEKSKNVAKQIFLDLEESSL